MNKSCFRVLPSIFKVDVLAQLTDLDKTLKPMKDAYINRNFENFKSIFYGAGQFYNIMQVTFEGIILIDNRIAVPEALQKAVLNHLHRNHPGQLAMTDAASYLWWLKMNRSIIEKAEKCERCTKYGKILKTLQG